MAIKIKPNDKIIIEPWMTSKMNLKGTELLIYAKIYAFCVDKYSGLDGGIEYLMAICNVSKPAVITALQSLRKKGLIDRVKNNKKTVYRYRIMKEVILHLDENISETEYDDSLPMDCGKETLPLTEKAIQNTSKETLLQNDKGKESLPVEVKKLYPVINSNKISIDRNSDFQFFLDILTKIFGSYKIFDEKTCAEFFSLLNQNFDKSLFEKYVVYVFNLMKKQQPEKRISYFYKIFKNPTTIERFIFDQKQFPDNELPRSEKKVENIVCPVCNTVHEKYRACPECELSFLDFNDSKAREFSKKFYNLPEAKKINFKNARSKIEKNSQLDFYSRLDSYNKLLKEYKLE